MIAKAAAIARCKKLRSHRGNGESCCCQCPISIEQWGQREGKSTLVRPALTDYSLGRANWPPPYNRQKIFRRSPVYPLT